MADHIAKKTVLEREGWTEAAIKRFLPEPDLLRKNPNYRSAAPMKLYLVSRVEEVEKGSAFIEFVEKNKARRAGAQKAVQTKIKRMNEYVDGLEIELPDIPKEELTLKACEHYNNRLWYRKECYEEWTYRNFNESLEEQEPDFREATPDSDDSFLNRITLNYVRHAVSNYERILTSMGGKPGKDDVYDKLKEKVNKAICAKYDWLHEVDYTFFDDKYYTH